MNRKEELHQIKMIPLKKFIESWGFVPEKEQENKSWFKALNREEKTASVCIYTKGWYDDWWDYGSSEGGTIIDFCMIQMNMKYVEALRMLRKYL